MFDRLKNALAPWVAWFSTFSLPARFLIGATVSAIGSAGAVGAITKLGAYWFVVYYGVRTPADGLPYVAETAAAVSFVLLTSAATVYIMAYWFVTLWLSSISGKECMSLFEFVLSPKDRDDDRDRLKTVSAVLTCLWIWPIGMYLLGYPFSAMTFGAISAYQTAISFCITRSLRRVPVWKLSVAMAILTATLSLLLWLPPTYGWFLRTIGHGGGRYCTVHLGGEPFPRQIKGYLVVRTGTALLMFDGKEETIEIPMEHVLRIEQPTKMYWCLPGNCTPPKAVR